MVHKRGIDKKIVGRARRRSSLKVSRPRLKNTRQPLNNDTASTTARSAVCASGRYDSSRSLLLVP
ncbi:hypothetical protein D3C76_1656110 [compost metagenome]